ncbi:MAG: hypothetical protein ACI9DC_000261 [Gammaproteobacteria bacterium]
MHDILTLDRRSIPGCAVISEGFIPAAEAQSKALGFEPAIVWLAHPIQNRTEEELAAMAVAAVTDILQKIVANEQ